MQGKHQHGRNNKRTCLVNVLLHSPSHNRAASPPNKSCPFLPKISRRCLDFSTVLPFLIGRRNDQTTTYARSCAFEYTCTLGGGIVYTSCPILVPNFKGGFWPLVGASSFPRAHGRNTQPTDTARAITPDDIFVVFVVWLSMALTGGNIDSNTCIDT